jgi:hypothetical protein
MENPMSDNTTHLGLPYVANKQAQRHIFHDEALRILDALVMLSVNDRDLSAPPASPVEGDRYIVKAPGSGAFAGKDNRIAHYADGAWFFYAPSRGWLCHVADESALLAWDGTAWQPALSAISGLTALQNLSLLGVGTTADAANPLSAKLNNALWTAKTVAEGGDGNLRYKLSKESAAKTLSLLLQDNFSGRAEVGLTGDDDLHFKVSADGATWFEAMVVDRASGVVRFPSLVSLPVSPQGRLTLASGTPVMTSDQAAKTTVYYTPYLGQFVPIYDGTRFIATDTGGELSQATTDTTKSPAAVAANSNYDIFACNDGGTMRATRGPAWTSDTARGTGAGTTELQRLNGIWTNKNAVTNGPAANRGTYVGTVRSNASAQIDFLLGGTASGGSAAMIGVWNAYNRRQVKAAVIDSASYTYSTATWRAAHNSNANRISAVFGLSEDAVAASVSLTVLVQATNATAYVGIALDSTSAQPAHFNIKFFAASTLCEDPVLATYEDYPGLGFHYLQCMEKGDGTNANTFNARACGLLSAVIVA